MKIQESKEDHLKNFLKKIESIAVKVPMQSMQNLLVKRINEKLSSSEQLLTHKEFLTKLDLFKSKDETKPKLGYLLNLEPSLTKTKGKICEYQDYEELLEFIKESKYKYFSIHLF